MAVHVRNPEVDEQGHSESAERTQEGKNKMEHGGKLEGKRTGVKISRIWEIIREGSRCQKARR